MTVITSSINPIFKVESSDVFAVIDGLYFNNIIITRHSLLGAKLCLENQTKNQNHKARMNSDYSQLIFGLLS